MGSEALVQLALNTLSCSQKELALHLGVSPTQVSKWKKGEHMSREMDERIREVVNIGDRDPEFVLWSGSLEDADKWEKLILFLARWAQEDAETGYDTYPLRDEDETLCWSTFHTLNAMGIKFPSRFPEELDLDCEQVMSGSGADPERLWDLLQTNPYSALIYQIYQSLNNVFGFYAAYVAEFINDDELNLYDTKAANIEYGLMDLAACKVDVDERVAPNFKAFKYQVTKDFDEWLNIVKESAFRANRPLRAELLSMVYGSSDALGHEAEAESLGFNSSRIHPDVYMNELLCGMRVIHQVLPAIMKKLGIDKEFQLDESKLRADR
jgi:transcriptional regulator with XRE-family HTH domain